MWQNKIKFLRKKKLTQELLSVDLREFHVLHFSNVSTCSKGLLTACDHHGTNLRVLVKLVECFPEFLHQWTAQSVEGLGTGEFDESHIVLLTSRLCKDVFIREGGGGGESPQAGGEAPQAGCNDCGSLTKHVCIQYNFI